MGNMTITAIQTAADHRDAIAVISRIMSLEAPKKADLAMLETISVLVERYAQTHFPMEEPTALDAIRFRMDQMDINQSGLAKLIGFPKSRISDLMNGKRPLSLEMIRALHEALDIPSDILIGRTDRASS